MKYKTYRTFRNGYNTVHNSDERITQVSVGTKHKNTQNTFGCEPMFHLTLIYLEDQIINILVSGSFFNNSIKETCL